MLVVVLAASRPVPVAAFDSIVPGYQIHEWITQDAADSAGFSNLAGWELAAAAARPDARESRWLDLWHGHLRFLPPDPATYRPEHHFDRGRGVTHADAFRAGAAYVRACRARALARAEAGDRRAAIAALGEAIHALQDFFSHSNFVDLPPSARATCLQALGDPARAPPASLRITAYFPDARSPEEPDDPLGYTHGSHSKDSEHKNRDASGRPDGPRGPTRFELARRAALRATIALLAGMRAELGPERWNQLAGTGTDRGR